MVCGKHLFHPECFKKAFKHDPRCPMCRAPLKRMTDDAITALVNLFPEDDLGNKLREVIEKNDGIVDEVMCFWRLLDDHLKHQLITAPLFQSQITQEGVFGNVIMKK